MNRMKTLIRRARMRLRRNRITDLIEYRRELKRHICELDDQITDLMLEDAHARAAKWTA